MLLWLLIAILAMLAGGALLLALRLRADKQAPADATEQHFRSQLNEIENDLQSARISDAEAEAAKAELARELVRFRKQQPDERMAPVTATSWTLAASALAAPLLAVALYVWLGQPQLPSQPLAGREPPAEISFDEAVEQIEARLAETPDDVRGWRVLAPAYMRAGRFADAESAYRRVIELAGREPAALTDLAESMLMQADGVAGPEILALLNEAVELEPANVRARFYLAGEATRAGQWDDAVAQWQDLIALAEGGEPWLQVAQNGLAIAQARGEVPVATQTPESDSADQQEMIRGMVDQLATRLAEQGGSVDEWTQLVRSYLVLGEMDLAREAYDKAVETYPDPAARTGLEALAREAGLVNDE